MKATDELTMAVDFAAIAELKQAFERRAMGSKHRAQTPQQFANALNKRRAANKAARKARKR